MTNCDKMNKILFIGGLKAGGAEHQMVVLARLLKKEGYDITYLSMDRSTFYINELNEVSVPIVQFKDSRLASLLKLNIPRNVINVYKLLKKNKYDIVITFLGEWNFINCLLANCRKTRHKAITGIRNNRDEVFLKSREKFYAWFERNALYKVSNSWSAHKKYSLYYPNLSHKLKVIYNVVELPIIHSLYECKKDGRVNVIVPASYREVKNPMKLLEAVLLMNKADRENLKIDWYGSITAGKVMYNKMLNFIKEHNLERTITLHDAINDIANQINEADIIGLFSTSEGLPNAVCEGMMLGKPVIMTNVSDYDVLVDDSNGIICDSMNVHSIKDALTFVSSLSQSDIINMGTSSKSKAQTLFSEQSIIQQWKNII